jgi:hypothetical protein
MVNPSTADAKKDDPTIRKCVGFSRRWGCGGLDVVNLYAFRATDLSVMLKATDPVGPENDVWIEKMCTLPVGPVIVAWGSNMQVQARGHEVTQRLARHHDVYALKVTMGPPWHPLYVSYREEPILSRKKAA